MKYSNQRSYFKPSKITTALLVLFVIAIAAIAGAIGTRVWYESQLEPASSVSKTMVVEIEPGATVQEIADDLESKNIIKNSQAFLWYVRNNDLVEDVKAGTYELDAANSTPEIVDVITIGKVQENLVTILPGQRLEQIKTSLIDNGFSEQEVTNALMASNYKGHPALVAKPSNQSLEGYLFPESFKVNSATTAKDVVELALDEMAEAVTPEIIVAWQKQGLGVHQAISLASIVENEVSDRSERSTVAGVFYNRLNMGMKLESDPTYLYAGYITGQPGNSSIDSPYNTYAYAGIPPGPISNVSKSSLEAVAYPKSHDYLFFVAGDDGITRFSKTLAEHEEKTAKYCIDLCKSY